MSDGNTSVDNQTFNITVNATDDAPTLDINTGFTLSEGTESVIGSDQLDTNDVDTTDDNLTYTLDSTVPNGALYLDNDGSGSFNGGDTQLNIGGTFTQQNINDGSLRYLHDGGDTTSDGFQFDVSDGTTSIDNQTLNITINQIIGTPTPNNDTLIGTAGNDAIDALAGNDTINALDGNDVIFASLGVDTIDGGEGIDTFDLSTSTGVTTNWVNLEVASAQFRVDSGMGFASRGSLTGIENVSDSAGNDRFFGDSGENTYFYSAGLDTVDGNGGFDTLDISAMTRGFQWIDLQASSFQLRSNDGAGWIANAAITEVENFITTDDIDHFRGDSGDQTIRYIGGRDFIDGRDGSDTIDMSEYDAGNWVNLNIAFDQFRFFNGAGFQSGGNMQNVENVIGGDGNDFFYADGADNFYFGGLGNDRFEGGAGTDTFQVDGVLGDYTLSESGGTYTMSGISGTDTLIDVEQVQIGDTVYDIAALDALI